MSEYKGLFLLAGLSEEEKKKIISCLPSAVKFKMGEISTMKCVGEMVDIILSRCTK